MSKRVLIYGDSNSWGYLDDGSGQRFDQRWPVVMRHSFTDHQDVTLIEECLPGRTTNCPDPQEGNHFNGAEPLMAILMSHQPLDHVIIMLGTNDMKARFRRDAEDISGGILELVTIISQSQSGLGGWNGTKSPAVTVICPPMLGERADNPGWIRYDEWLGGFETSQLLPAALGRACQDRKINFINGNEGALSSDRDPIHWAAETHRTFGRFIAETMTNILDYE